MSDNIDDGCWQNGKPIYGIDCTIIHNGTRSVGFRIAHSDQWEIVNICGSEFPLRSSDVSFEPIKTDRELAIEAALKVFNVGPETDKLLFTMAGALFDAGLLRSKNES